MNRRIRTAACRSFCALLTVFAFPSLVYATTTAVLVPVQSAPPLNKNAPIVTERVEITANTITQAVAPLPNRPRIGLVLGGGGARGLAHIGVLKVLEQNHIPVDCIVGTSIGALVGGGYAAGQTSATMAEKAEKTDWDQLFSPGLPRQQMSYRAKQDDSLHLAPIDVGVRDDLSLALPKSAMDTQKIEVLLRDLTFAGTAPDFNALSVPFRALATDLESGDMVVMGDGDLVTAMRASMAVPGVFPPVPRSDKLLVDGGLSRNLGVDVARKMCADVIIAVDVAMPPLKRDGIQTIFNVADQYTRLMIVQNERPQIDSLKSSDILITPPLGNIESLAFNRAKDLITIGEKGANQQLAQLQRYAMSAEDYQAWEAQRDSKKLQAKPIQSIEVARLSRVNPDVLSRNVEIETGKRFQGKTFNEQLSRLYARGDFSQLDYELLDNGAGQKLRLIPVEKDWGPNYLNFGLALGTDFDDSSPYALLARYRRTWMNALGGEMDVTLRAGDTMALSAEFYQPLQIDGYAFIAPNASIMSSPLAGYENGKQVSQYRYHKETAGIDLGSGFGRYGEVRVGLLTEYFRLAHQLGPDLFGNGGDDFRQHDYGVHATFSYDQLNHADFPSTGAQFKATTYQAIGGDDKGEAYGKVEFSGRQAFSFGKTSGYLMAKGRISHNLDNAGADVSWMGGFMNMSSYAYQSLVGQNYLYGRFSLYRPLPFLQSDNKSTWIGFATEVGEMRDVRDKTQGGTHYSGVGFIGVDTFMGPLYLGAAYGDNKEMRYYLTLGNPF